MNGNSGNGKSRSAIASSPVHAALADAAAWRLIGVLFERPRTGWEDHVAALGHEVKDAMLSQAVIEARRAATELGSSAASAYLSILGPGGTVSPREVAYRNREDPGGILADLSAFHTAFAFRPSRSTLRRPGRSRAR